MKILIQKFFNRPAEIIAKELIGKVLCRKIGKRIFRGIIAETEAYIGPEDKASHAHKGKTERNYLMFGPAGYWYIYFIYGMYWMLNIVTGKKSWPAAVLIRGVKMQDINGNYSINLNGPGKLTNFFKIDKKINGKLALPQNDLWFEDAGIKIDKLKIKKLHANSARSAKASRNANAPMRIQKLPRIGVDYAGPVWSKKLLRFKI